MVKKTAFLIIVAVILFPGRAAGHGIGTDFIRLFDRNQGSGSGMINIHGQIGVAGDAAVTLGYAGDDNLVILESGIKYYFGRYMDSSFIQLGIGYYDRDTHRRDFGLIPVIGYERKLSRYLAISGTIRMVAGVDADVIGYNKSPVFQPGLSILITY